MQTTITELAERTASDPDWRAIAAIRGLAMDAPHAARSGHQGTAMALAPLAHVLWHRVLRYDPSEPEWPDRDRLILSCGHASALLYAMLHLSGYDLTLDDLRDFRQLGSRTPGHPEAGELAGVEVTTGPLGQGFANGVGMAVAERWLRHRFSPELCDHHIYVLCSDGDLAEGVSHEAASLAGHLGLGRLICIYDDNRISIDGTTDEWLSDDALKRFDAYGWHTQQLGEAGEDLDLLEAAILDAQQATDAPSLLVLRTHIGYPSPDQVDQPAVHGYALFDEEIARAKELMGIPADETFWVPPEVPEHYRTAASRGAAARQAWQTRLDAADRTAQADWATAQAGMPREGWQAELLSLAFDSDKPIATRAASQQCLNQLAELTPGLVAGGADLTGNTGTKLASAQALSKAVPDGQQILFGVREHAMGSAMVGMARHGGLLPVGGTFLVFSDYMRPAVRLAALSQAKAVFVWSHDSVAVGEDGPTHQPVEHVASLRAIPDLVVIRPADAHETVGAWLVAAQRHGPTALILTRQGVPVLAETSAEQVAQGAYIIAPSGKSSLGSASSSSAQPPELVLIGTGSEVAVCLAAAQLLAQDGVSVQVVSMPSWELFETQPSDYQAAVLPPGVPAVSVEAGSTLGWHRWASHAVGIDRFGASAPGAQVMESCGITPETVYNQAKQQVV